MPRQKVRDFGTCLKFVKSNSDRVTLKTTKILADKTNATVSLWFNTGRIPPDSTNTLSLYVERAASGNNIWKFEIYSNRRIRFVHRNDSNTLSNPVTFSGLEVVDGRWHMATMVKSGTTVNIYVDGVFDHTHTLTGNDSLNNASINARIGGDAQDANVYFEGLIDEVRLYDRALSASEVADLFYLGSTADTSNLLGYYKFDEGSGTSVTDSAGVQSAGTITGATYSSQVPMKSRT